VVVENYGLCERSEGALLIGLKRQPELARKRADAIRRYLVKNGIERERIIMQGQGYRRLVRMAVAPGVRGQLQRVEVDWCQG
jgi:outer membrane protein OmpA-like peptidoglycan-associated protein